MSHQHVLINGNGPTGTTLQHYLVNNHIPNTSDHANQNVHVQIVKQEQAQQRFILNRQYLQQNQNQTIQVVHQQELRIYWLIVDIESNSELNTYVLVESKDVIGQPPLESLGTGKLVIVNINGKQRRATVVMASDDKNFIFAEYNQLTKMAEDNLKLRDGQVKKRRRISGSDVSRKDADDDSSLSGWSDRVMSPSVNVNQKLSKNEQRYVPPMMFDQGVQTDNRLTGSTTGGVQDKILELQKLLELNEHVLNEQKLLKNEANLTRLLIQSFSDEFSAMRKSMQAIEGKVESILTEPATFQQVPQDSMDEKKKILNGSGTQPYYIIQAEGTTSEGGTSLNGSNLEYTLEELEGVENVRSASRISFHDQTSMMSNSSMEFNGNKRESFRRSHSSSNFSVNSTSSTPIARASSISNLIEEWTDMEGDVTIGSNKTMVPVHVLRAIDWKNYKTATRKLLITLFKRETLATRSLTGRPSPAFHDRNKPVKDKLDQNIINDIIQIVTKKCNVQESHVRTAITTKCADENKMLRNRKENEEKEKFKTPTSASSSSRIVESNKENVVDN